MSNRTLIGGYLVALSLLGCGDGGSGGGSGPAAPVRQFGATESALYEPAQLPGGIVVGPGSGLVTLQLEPAAGPAAPRAGDTAAVGVDEMWFDVDQKGSVSLNLTELNLTRVSRMEILDTKGLLLLWADSARRQASGLLEPGRYRLRLVAAPAATGVTLVDVWMGGSAPQASPAELARLATGNCVNCNLYGADLSGYNLRGVNLTGADLRHATLVTVPGGYSLSGTDLMTIYIGGAPGAGIGGADLSASNLTAARLDGAIMAAAGRGPASLAGTSLAGASLTELDLAHARLSGANLSGADLSRSLLAYAELRGANLAGAVLRAADLMGADLSAANLVGADFTGARLDGATWTDGRSCAPGSIGVCR